jgi:uncharacterized membrane protein
VGAAAAGGLTPGIPVRSARGGQGCGEDRRQGGRHAAEPFWAALWLRRARAEVVNVRRPSRESVRAAVWFRPALATVGAFALASAALQVRTGADDLLWPGDVESASSTLQAIATSVITATSLTFSLVVVALQLASQQFSPRLLREFARDGVIQTVLAVLIATFVYCLTVLRSLDGMGSLPALAVLLGFLLAVASAAALVSFLSHIARALRVDTMMVAVHRDTKRVMHRGYPPLGQGAPLPDSSLPGPDGGTLLTARRSGFIEWVEIDRLVGAFARQGVFVRLRVRPGDHVTFGTPVASAWASERPLDVDAVGDALADAMGYGYERTFEQDVAFGFRQLSDIAVKALSPGINDPTTAAHAIGYAADLLRDLHCRKVGPAVFDDERGTVRLVMPDRDYRYYLDLAIGQIRRYGGREPTVLVALLGLLRDVATAVHSDEQREEVLRQVDLVVGELHADVAEVDAESVHDVARRVRQAVCGDVDGAYRDRSGETRSY